MWAAWTLAVVGDDLTLVGYAALGLGVVAAAASAILATGSRVRRSGTDRDRVVADVRATISELAEPTERVAVPPQLARWELHAAEVARRQLDLYLRHSAQALRQSTTSFILGMAAASLGFIAFLGSLAWLLASDRDIGWVGVISGRHL